MEIEETSVAKEKEGSIEQLLPPVVEGKMWCSTVSIVVF